MSEKLSLGIIVREWAGDDFDLALVGAVRSGGIAEAAGIEVGDLLVEIDGMTPLEWFKSGSREGRVSVAVTRVGKREVLQLKFPSSDPLAGIFEKRAEESVPDDNSDLEVLTRSVVDLRRQVEARRPPPVRAGSMTAAVETPKPPQAAPPPADDGQARRDWLTKYGRTGREAAPPMTGMRHGWSWIDTQT